jgi:ribosomal protein L23
MSAPFAKASRKIYFPNFTLKLVRSNLPPNQAVLHCPPQLTKLDIKDFCTKVYGLSVSDVRTMNYLAGPKKRARGGKSVRGTAAYKKAIVTMTSDFVWPAPPQVIADEAVRVPPRTSRYLPCLATYR